MSLTFYRAPMSTATVTELVLAELDVPHETVTLDIQKGETKKAAHTKIDPNGRVPVLVHDGTPIWESAAITIYVGETFGEKQQLWPAAGPKRGEAMKWVVWANVTLGDAVMRWRRSDADGKKDLERCLAILDEALEGRSFLCGDYTLADTHVHSFMDWLRFMKVDLSPYARIEAWSRRCAARPAYARVMNG